MERILKLNTLSLMLFCSILVMNGALVQSFAADGTREVILLQPCLAPDYGSRIDFDYNFRKSLPPFPREPAYTNKEVARGLIPTTPETAFLRNINDNELYISIDHSSNFVDGKRQTYRGNYLGHMIFRGIDVSSLQGDLVIPYTVDMFTYEQGAGGWLQIRNAWAAEILVAGEKWLVGVIDNLDGKLDDRDTLYMEPLRPVASTKTAGTTNAAKRSKSILVNPLPKKLFLNNTAYNLDLHFVKSGTNIAVQTTLEQCNPALGPLTLSIKGARYIRLKNADYAVILAGSISNVAIPVGTYEVADCLLHPDPALFRVPQFIRSDQEINISTGKTALLTLGLPLTNIVSARQEENIVQLTYQLRGAGSEQYEFYNWRKRPQFTIQKGSFQVASGALPFG